MQSNVFSTSRRSVLAALTLLPLSRMAGAVEPWTWMWVLTKLAEGALSYAGGKIVGSLDSQPSPSQLESSIRAAISDLEANLKEDFRKAILQDRVRELEAMASSIQINLDRYSFLDVRDRKRYRRLIETAEAESVRGIALAQQYEIAALPVRAMMISQRSIAMAGLFQLDRSVSGAKAYGVELAGHAMRLTADLDRYVEGLAPEKRLGPIECEPYTTPGGGFGIRTYTCKFTEDGKLLPTNVFGDLDPENSDQRKGEVRLRTDQLRVSRATALRQFKQEQQDRWITGMAQVAGIWNETARKLSTTGRRQSASRRTAFR